MSSVSKVGAEPSISYTEEATDGRRIIPDSDLVGTHPFSAARLWNREPLDDFYKEALEKYPNEASIDPIEEMKLRNKIDRLIIPWYVEFDILIIYVKADCRLVGFSLAVCYAFYVRSINIALIIYSPSLDVVQYIDKTTLSYAAIFGIKSDLNLHGTQYRCAHLYDHPSFLFAFAYPLLFLKLAFVPVLLRLASMEFALQPPHATISEWEIPGNQYFLVGRSTHVSSFASHVLHPEDII